MASPFQVFRKYQKSLLVVGGVVLMFVFVAGDPLTSLLRDMGGAGGSRSGMEAGDVAVRWDDGKLTNRELGALVMQRRVVNDFLGNVEMAGRAATLDAGVEVQPLTVQWLGGPDTAQQGVEKDVLRTRLCAQLARQAGMSVSNENITGYLIELGRRRVSPDLIRAMIVRMRSAGRGVSLEYLYDALREEMLAHNYTASYMFSVATVLPEQQWQDWLQVNDRVVVEAAGLPVSSFLVDVPEPTDEQLAEFFALYKDNEPGPVISMNTELPSPNPGFAIPRKVDVRYVCANYDQLLEKYVAEVTDKEIQDYYDANKQYFIRADSGLMGEDAAAAENADAATPADDDAATDDAADPPAAETETPADAATPADDDSTPASPAAEDSSQRESERRSPFRFVAAEQEVDAPAAEDSPAADEAVASEPTEEAAATEPAMSPQPSAQGAAGALDATVEYQSLDEVRDEIRRQLANEKVQQHLTDEMGKLLAKLKAEFLRYLGSSLDARAAGQEPPVPPAALADLEALAKENGLTYGETGPMSWLELRELPIGISRDPDTGELLLQVMFSDEHDLYKPVATVDLDGNRYLSMKESDTPRRVPELGEIRDEVVRAWKLQKAAELAEKRTQELATKIEQSGSTLADYFAGDPAVVVDRTDPFSWLTAGNVTRTGQVPFRLSEPTGIQAAGPDFMEAVFGLGDGQVGAVLNNDHSVAYIVRVVEHQESRETLRQAFLAEMGRWPGVDTMNRHHAQQATSALWDGLYQDAGVDWVREPDQIRGRDEE